MKHCKDSNACSKKSKQYCTSSIQKKPRYADITYARIAPKCCDLCHRSISLMDFYADAVVPGGHQWGFLCQECIEAKQVTFSPETGQLYKKQKKPKPGQEWLQVAGQSDLPRDCVEPFFSEDGKLYGYTTEDGKYHPYDDD